jgi:hypothetical protein
MSAGFQELLSAHLLAAGERQEVARGVIGGRRYGVDLAAGTITFADGPIIAAEMIGSASTEDGSWFWAWGNRSLGLPDDRLLASRRVAEQGAGLAVPELTEPRLELGDLIEVHSLGSVSTGLLDSDAYFVAEDGPIAVLLSLTAEPLALPPLDGSMLTTTLMSNLGRYELPHRPMIECFLRRRGARLSDDQGALDALLPSGERVRIIFDELERCTSVERPDVVIVTGALKVTRRKGGWRDRARRYRILIDGEEHAAIGPGDTATVELPVGTHSVMAQIDWMTSPELPVLIRGGETIELRCEPSGGARAARRQIAETPGEYITLRSGEGE